MLTCTPALCESNAGPFNPDFEPIMLWECPYGSPPSELICLAKEQAGVDLVEEERPAGSINVTSEGRLVSIFGADFRVEAVYHAPETTASFHHPEQEQPAKDNHTQKETANAPDAEHGMFFIALRHVCYGYLADTSKHARTVMEELVKQYGEMDFYDFGIDSSNGRYSFTEKQPCDRILDGIEDGAIYYNMFWANMYASIWITTADPQVLPDYLECSIVVRYLDPPFAREFRERMDKEYGEL